MEISVVGGPLELNLRALHCHIVTQEWVVTEGWSVVISR